MRETDRLFLGGVMLFVAGAVTVLVALEQGDRFLALLGLAGIVGSVLCFGIGAWRIHTRVDWDRVEAEQRLWESGPLGRAWLKVRKTLLRR